MITRVAACVGGVLFLLGTTTARADYVIQLDVQAGALNIGPPVGLPPVTDELLEVSGATGGTLDTGEISQVPGSRQRGYAAADLATGSMRIFVDSLYGGTYLTAAGASVSITDQLRFQLPAELTSADVGIRWVVEGSNTFYGGLTTEGTGCGALLSIGAVSFDTGIGNCPSTMGRPGPIRYDFHDVLTVAGDVDYQINMQLFFQAFDNRADFANTAYVLFDLPVGVTFTSDSGVFLTNPVVPLPAAAWLLVSGLAALASFARRNGTRARQ